MGITHIRIDERLVHGQVASAWSNTLGVNRIMVVNDAANADDFAKQMLRMATPAALELSVLTVEKAVTRIKSGQYDLDKVLMVLKDAQDALSLFEAGYKFTTVNLGNCSKKDAQESIATGIYINSFDKKALDKLVEYGVDVTIQMTPANNVVKY